MASIQTTIQHDKRQGFHSDTVAMPALTARHRVPLRQIEATRLTKTNTSDVDADALAAELRRHVRGEVRFDDGSRALYATDGSNYRQVPIGVVIPRNVDDIMATVATARRYGAPVLARGGGTSLAGQCCNVVVVLDMSKYMHNILDLDPEHRFAHVQPGLVLDDLRKAAYKHGLSRSSKPGDVILWPDTFNNHFHPELLHAAFNSLRRLDITSKFQSARSAVADHYTISDFYRRPRIFFYKFLMYCAPTFARVNPLIVLEPSCASVFRDEIVNFFPENSDLIRLSQQTLLLSEFL